MHCTDAPADLLARNLHASINAKLALLDDATWSRAFVDAADAVVRCYRAGGRLYIAGNGGSAADAQHLAAEFVSKLARDRAPLPAEALTTDSSIITAIGNDYGFDQVFARQLAGKARAGDMFLGITTSGESPNILRALHECGRLGLAQHRLQRARRRPRARVGHALPGGARQRHQHDSRAAHRAGPHPVRMRRNRAVRRRLKRFFRETSSCPTTSSSPAAPATSARHWCPRCCTPGIASPCSTTSCSGRPA